MTCSTCDDKPTRKPGGDCGKLPPVLQVHNEECPVVFHTVELAGTSKENPPYIGQYRNVLLTYTNDDSKYLFSSDGIPAELSDATDFNKLLNRPKYAGEVMTSDTDIPDVVDTVAKEAEARDLADQALQADIESVNQGLQNEVAARNETESNIYETIATLDSSLAKVAKTGSYNDLTDKPTSFDANNGKLTIQKNGVDIAEFTANSDIDVLANIPVPTKTSELTNDSGFIGDDDLATVARTGSYNDLSNRPNLATVATTGSYNDLTDKPAVDSALSTTSANAIQNQAVSNALDRAVITDLIVDPNVSTSIVQLDATKTNLRTSSSTVTNIPLPVASATQAGVMNSSTYNAIVENSNNINAILNGSCAVDDLPANPTQAQLTAAWQAGTGLDEPVNRSLIYDSANDKLWTYYLGADTWYATAASIAQVDVSQFTNSSLGTIKGSTNNGQIYAENDGTGSVNGWDTLTSTVSDHTSKLSTIAQGAEVNVQANWAESDATSDAYIQNKPTLATVATTGSYSDLTGAPSLATVATTGAYSDLTGTPTLATVATTGSYNDLTDKPAAMTVDSTLSATSTNAVENQAITNEFGKVAYIGDSQSTPSSTEFVSTNNIIDGAVTNAKIADGAVTVAKTNFKGTNMDTGSLELYGSTPYVDFHYGNNAADYTQRIVADTSTTLNIVASGGVKVNGKPLETVLYNNASGSNGAITLSESAANFNYLKIFFRNNDAIYSSVEVYSPNGKVVCLTSTHVSNTGKQVLETRLVTVSGTSVNTYNNQYGEYVTDTSTNSYVNNIYITRVVGGYYA